ncbi:MAG: peptidase P60, partial [Hyphomonas sp. 32-62-5]
MKRAEIVAAARGWLGTPYRHQASLKGAGCDCLGLVRGVWREVIGPEPEAPPPYTPDWAEALGRETLLEAARRRLDEVVPVAARAGDVLIFRMGMGVPAKHCAILSNDGRIIHAYWG